jgi:hypothetical protein
MAGAREHEVRMTGLALAAVALLVAAVAIWAGVSFGEKLRSHATNAPVPQASISR